MVVVRTDNLRKEFGTLVAVDNVNFEIEKGHVVGLIGPNGAGKTTLLRMLATVLHPTDGSADIFSNHLVRDHIEIRKSIGYLPDFFNLYNDLTLEECLRFFARAYGMPEDKIPALVDQTLEYVELTYKRKDFIRNLSRGMVQRLGVAALMVHDPELFILDEPASGLDPKARIQLRSVLKKLSNDGKTVIISSHILTELSGFCTHIAIMDHGKLVMYGGVDEIEKRISGSRKVEIVLLDSVDDAKEIIENTDGMEIIEKKDHSLVVGFQGDLSVIADLNATLVKKSIRVAGITEHTTNLEDLFLKIASAENLNV